MRSNSHPAGQSSLRRSGVGGDMSRMLATVLGPLLGLAALLGSLGLGAAPARAQIGSAAPSYAGKPLSYWQDLLAAKKFLIPYAAEWTAALNLSSPVTVTNADDGLEDPLCAMPAGEGTLIDAQTITVAGGQAPFASQRVWAMGTAADQAGRCAGRGSEIGAPFARWPSALDSSVRLDSRTS